MYMFLSWPTFCHPGLQNPNSVHWTELGFCNYFFLFVPNFVRQMIRDTGKSVLHLTIGAAVTEQKLSDSFIICRTPLSVKSAAPPDSISRLDGSFWPGTRENHSSVFRATSEMAACIPSFSILDKIRLHSSKKPGTVVRFNPHQSSLAQTASANSYGVSFLCS